MHICRDNIIFIYIILQHVSLTQEQLVLHGQAQLAFGLDEGSMTGLQGVCHQLRVDLGGHSPAEVLYGLSHSFRSANKADPLTLGGGRDRWGWSVSSHLGAQGKRRLEDGLTCTLGCSYIHRLLLRSLSTLGLLKSLSRVKGMGGWSSCPNEGPWGGRKWGFRRRLRGKRGSRGTRERDLSSKIP